MSQPHFIVFANEKGGTGKSTTAVHTAIALAASGHRVGALDLDSRQRTMTRYLENRDATMRRLEKELPQAAYEVLEDETEAGLAAALGRLADQADVIVIDTPGRDDPIARAAILKADRGMVFDNSDLNQPPSHCLTFANGRLVFAVPRLPGWIRSVYEAELEI